MNSPKSAYYMKINPHAFLAYAISIILLLSFLLRIFHWADYLDAIQNTYFYILFGRPNPIYILLSLIVIEGVTAIFLLFKNQRQKGAFVSFLLFNLFLISSSLDKKLALNKEYAVFWAENYVEPLCYVIIIILVSLASMWIYANSSSKIAGTKIFIINSIIYIFIAILLSYPLLGNKNQIFHIQTKDDMVNLIKDNCLLMPSDTNFDLLTYINLSELNCGSCRRNIDRFINIISSDTLLKNRTLILTSHPNQISGIARAKGWWLSIDNSLKFGYLPFEKLSNLGIENSQIFFFEPSGKLQGSIELSDLQNKLIKKISVFKNESINGERNDRTNN